MRENRRLHNRSFSIHEIFFMGKCICIRFWGGDEGTMALLQAFSSEDLRGKGRHSSKSIKNFTIKKKPRLTSIRDAYYEIQEVVRNRAANILNYAFMDLTAGMEWNLSSLPSLHNVWLKSQNVALSFTFF